jgi:predicted O-linked N-acetylglucosamine transferase (SPINDLY family)
MNLALSQYRLGKLDAATATVKAVIEADARNINAYMLLCVFQRERHRPRDAIKACDAIISLNPSIAEIHSNKAAILNELGEYQRAISSADSAIAIQPDFADAHLNRANALFNLKQFGEALLSYDKALAVRPDHAGVWLGRGNALTELDRFDAAAEAYDKALALKPDLAAGWLGRGNVFHDLKRHDEAFAAYERALALEPELAEAWLGRADLLYEQKRHDEALAAYETALTLKPDLAGGWVGRGNVFADLSRYDEASRAYQKALALQPDSEGAWLGQGNILSALKHYDDARAAFDRALQLNPGLEGAWSGRGNLFYELKKFDEAFAAYDRAFSLNPDLTGVEGARLHTKMLQCDWSNLDAECSHLIRSVADGKPNTAPWAFLIISSAADDQLKCARAWNAAHHPRFNGSAGQARRYGHRQIRIGYVSSDFHQHPIAQLTAGMFECHDRSKFEVTAISIGTNDRSELRARLEASFDAFLDARSWSDDEIAAQIAQREIDILIDLNGFTQHRRTGIFARRPAPIQVNYLGYPGTMGADYIDYIFGDPIVIPVAQRGCYSEKVVHLPHSYQINDAKRQIAEMHFGRGECGLPEQGFVFCCFNNSCKIMPRIFDCWMRILTAVEGSVLWLLQDNDAAAKHLRAEAAARNVDPDRLIFAGRLPLPEHLARHRLADLFLDTLPYNAHTTASDALWAGLPVLTQLGETFAGRVAASLLNATGLPELIVETDAEYEDTAISLARNPDRLAAIRQKLATCRATSPLFDTPSATRHIEAALLAIYRRHQAGLPPDHIDLRGSAATEF